MYAAHVSAAELPDEQPLGSGPDLLANSTDVVISMLRFDGTGSKVTREIWEMMLLTLWPRLELGGSVVCGKALLQSLFSMLLQLDVRTQSLCGPCFASLSTILSRSVRRLRVGTTFRLSPRRRTYF